MVEEAKAKAGALIDALLPLAEAGVAVVGLEPSCLLTLRAEALVMGLGPKAGLVATQALLFEDFLAREARSGRFTFAFRPAPAPTLLHAHAPQQALGEVATTLALVKRIPGP